MDMMTTSRPRNVRLSREAAFWAAAATTTIFPAASAAPSPLYAVYQAEWGFSASTLTAVFAVYALALLGTLLVAGALSDHVGRRPVLIAAIGLEILSLVLFVNAGDPLALGAARIVQGVATGAAISTLGATLIDLQPEHAPRLGGVVSGVATLAGLAAGALGSGLLVQLAPAPTTLIYVVLIGLLAASAVAVAAMPETSPRRDGTRASLRPRVSLPPRLRADMLALTPIFVASWSLGGLYMSLGPSVAARLFGFESHLIGGVVVTLLCGTGALTALLMRERDPGTVVRLAAAFLVGGMALTLAGVEADAAGLAILGSLTSGIGFGAAALGGFGSLARIGRPAERGEVFAVGYVISYLSFSIPAIAAGFATTAVGLHTTALGYAGLVAALSAVALASARSAAPRRSPCPA